MSIFVPTSVERDLRVYGIIRDGPMRGFDNLWFSRGESFPNWVVIADNMPTRTVLAEREAKLRELQTLHAHVDVAKRDYVKDLQKKKAARSYCYRLAMVLNTEPPRPVYKYDGEYRPLTDVERSSGKAGLIFP